MLGVFLDFGTIAQLWLQKLSQRLNWVLEVFDILKSRFEKRSDLIWTEDSKLALRLVFDAYTSSVFHLVLKFLKSIKIFLATDCQC